MNRIHIREFLRRHLYQVTILILVLTSLLSLPAMIAVQQRLTRQQAPNEELKPARYHYALVAEQLDSAFWQEVGRGARAAAAETDAVVELVGSQAYSSDRSAELVQIATAARLDGIATCVVDANATRLAVDEAVTAGIPVVTLENDAASSKRQAFVGVNSFDLGRSFGQIIEDRKTSGKIAILTSDDSHPVSLAENLVVAGLKDVLDRYSSYSVQAIEVDHSSAFAVENEVRRLLLDNRSQLSTIISLNAEDTLHVVEALADFGWTSDIGILCYQNNADIQEYVRSGLIQAMLVSDPFEIGYESIMALDELNRSNRTSDYYQAKLAIVDSTNIDSFIEYGLHPEKATAAASASRVQP